ncbi:hypothetical protein Vretifemale_2750 [Volvox reticuliferus]|nr:hypothetical protein Vretifemale_2750 [Volvox reticuliferus]
MENDDDLELPDIPPDFTETLFERCRISSGSLEEIVECLNFGADVFAWDEDSLTALHHAATKGNAAACEVLLGAAGGKRCLLACAAAPGQRFVTPLHLAAVHSPDALYAILRAVGVVDAVQSVVGTGTPADKGADPLDVVDIGRQTLLHYAATANNAASLELLLPLFSQRNGIDLYDAAGRTPLLCAAANNAVEAAKLLLRSGAAPQLCTRNGWSAFHHAAMRGCPAMLRVLHDHTVQAAGGKKQTLQVLEGLDNSKKTSLHVAAEYGCENAAGELLRLGASVTRRDADGATPLHLAARCGRTAVVKVLVEAARCDGCGDGAGHAVATARSCLYDNAGLTPAHLAAHANAVEVLRLLKLHGHDMNARTGEITHKGGAPQWAYTAAGWTPLHCAVALGAVEAVVALLEDLGADPHLTSGNGFRPFDLLVATTVTAPPPPLPLLLPLPPHAGTQEWVPAAADAAACADYAGRSGGGGPLYNRHTLDEDRILQMMEVFVRALHGPFGEERCKGAPGASAGKSVGGSSRATVTSSAATPGHVNVGSSSGSGSGCSRSLFEALSALTDEANLAMDSHCQPFTSTTTAPTAPQPCGPATCSQPASRALPPLPPGARAAVSTSPFLALAQSSTAAARSSSPPPQHEPVTPSQREPVTPPRRTSVTTSAANDGECSSSASGQPLQSPLPITPNKALPNISGPGDAISESMSPMNWPWGASTLNLAIMFRRDKVLHRLLQLLPPRTATVQLVPAKVQSTWLDGPGGGASGQQMGLEHQHQHQQPRRALVKLARELEDMTLNGASSQWTLDTWLARRFGSMSLSPARSKSGPKMQLSMDHQTGPMGTAAVAPWTAAATTVIAMAAASSERIPKVLPLPVRGLLAAVPEEQTAADADDKSRWPLFQTTAANRDTAVWIAMEQARDPRVRWAAMEVQAGPDPTAAVAAASAAASCHLWLGLAQVDGSGGGGGGGVLVRTEAGLWMGASSDGCPLPDACLVDLAQHGCVQQQSSSLRSGNGGAGNGGGNGGGGGGGSGGGGTLAKRLEKTLQLPSGGGRAGILWDVFGGTLLAVVNGGSPVVLADGLHPEPILDLPLDRVQEKGAAGTEEDGGAGRKGTGEGDGSGEQSTACAARMLVVGVQHPGWRLRLRGGRSGFSARCGCVDEMLISAEAHRGRADVPWPSKEPSMTSLHFASWSGNVGVLRQLVRDKGFPPNEPDADGWTPLHFAALAGHDEAVRNLLQLGAAPDLLTYHGCTASMFAAGSRMAASAGAGGTALVSCLQLIAEHGGSSLLHVRDGRGRTLLMLAAAAGNPQVAEWLLRQGLDPRAVDCDGKRTLQYANEHNDVYGTIEHALYTSTAGGVGQGPYDAGAAAANDGGNPHSHPVGPYANEEEDNSGQGGGRGGDPAHVGPPLRPWDWVVNLSKVKLVAGTLGEGSFGTVQGGTFQGVKVAVKTLKADSNLTHGEQLSLEKELSVLQSLFPHERIATFIGVTALPGGRRGLVFQRYDTNLHREFSHPDKARRLTPAVRFSIAYQIAEGLQFLHNDSRRIIHHDLKPDNVLLTAKFDVKLCDFGLSQALRSGQQLDGSHAMGNPYYNAPEVICGHPYDLKADVYSWGVILYQLATWKDRDLYCDGEHLTVVYAQRLYRLLANTSSASSIQPTAPTSMTDRLPCHVPPEVAELIRSCLADEPCKRPTIREALKRLKAMKVRELPGPVAGQAAVAAAAAAAAAAPGGV